MEKTAEKPLERTIFSIAKKDCFAYGRLNNKCSILTDTYCEKEKCKFYKTKTEYEKGRMKNE